MTEQHYYVEGHFPGYMSESSSVGCSLAEGLEMLSDALAQQTDHLDHLQEMCEEEGHYLTPEEAEELECEDCQSWSAYAELTYSTAQELAGWEEETLSERKQLRIMGEPERVEYLRAHGVSVHVPSGTVFDWIISLAPVEELTAESFGDGQEPCEHVALTV